MLSSVGGHGVHRLHRECFGSLTLADMDVPVGMMRPMTEEEISKVEIHPHPQLSPSPLTLALTLTQVSARGHSDGLASTAPIWCGLWPHVCSDGADR